jgi:hypothetical protein
LYQHGYLTDFKTESEYHAHMVNGMFDFDLFFRYVMEGREDIGHKDVFYERSRKAHEEFMKQDLVVDTRETWSAWWARWKEFDEAPLVPRD